MGIYNESLIEKAKARIEEGIRENKLKQMEKKSRAELEKQKYEEQKAEFRERFMESKITAKAKADAMREVYRPTAVQAIGGAINTFNKFQKARAKPYKKGSSIPKRYYEMKKTPLQNPMPENGLIFGNFSKEPFKDNKNKFRLF